MTQWVRHLATYLLKSSNDKFFSWSRFQEAVMSFGFLLHSRFGSRAASIEQSSSGLHWIAQRLSVWHTTNYHSSRLPSFYIWQLLTCHVEIKFRKFKVLPVLHVQIPIWKPRHTWVLQRYRWTYKTLFRRSLINRPIQNYRYHERILYVIQLSDRVYNVTFPLRIYILWPIKNGQSRETGNIGYTRRRRHEK